MRLPLIRASAILLLVASEFAPAAEVLDQQNNTSPSGFAESTGGGFLEVAQTFTVGVSGTLTRIGAQINWPGFGSPGNAILTVYSVSSGMPNANLGSATLSTTSIPSTGYAFLSFDLSSFAIPVHVNDVLAYGVSSDINTYIFARSTQNTSTYAGGQAMYRAVNPAGSWTAFSPGRDIGFQTYVNASASLAGDYNNSGAVNAADYVTWRLNPDGNGGTPAGYNTWRANFGAPGSGATPGSTVPEPTSMLLFVLGAVWLCWPVRFRP